MYEISVIDMLYGGSQDSVLQLTTTEVHVIIFWHCHLHYMPSDTLPVSWNNIRLVSVMIFHASFMLFLFT